MLCWVFTAAHRLSRVAGSGGHSLVAVHGLLTAVASPCGGAQALGCSGFGSWGTRAQLPRGIWDPPGPGIEPVSPASQGGFSTTGPLGKPPGSVLESGRSPGEGNGSLLQCLAWEIPWTEEPGGLQSMGLRVCVCVHSVAKSCLTHPFWF